MNADIRLGASSTATSADGIRIAGTNGNSAFGGAYDIGLRGAPAIRYVPVVDLLPTRAADRATTARQVHLATSASTASENETLPTIITREELARELRMLEQQYGVTSETFYVLWQAGQAPARGIDALRWAALWEAWRERYLI